VKKIGKTGKVLCAILLATCAFESRVSYSQSGPTDAQAKGSTGATAAQNAVAARGRGGEAPAMCNAPCDPYPGMKKLLVVADVQSGYEHDSINHDMAVIEELGRKTGIYVAYLRSDSLLITKAKITVSSKRYENFNNARNLNYFDAIFLLGSGEGTLSDQQKSDLISFVREDGKGLILGHGQGVNFYNWPEFGDMAGGVMACIGSQMPCEFPATGMYAKLADPSWKAAAAFGKESFFWTDQWPILQPKFKEGSVHTIVELDPSKMTAQQRSTRPDDYFPIVWAKEYGKGRVFNFTGGHNDATIDDPRSQALLLEGIEWALGITNEDARPDK
jgi:hypothetical protein